MFKVSLGTGALQFCKSGIFLDMWVLFKMYILFFPGSVNYLRVCEMWIKLRKLVECRVCRIWKDIETLSWAKVFAIFFGQKVPKFCTQDLTYRVGALTTTLHTLLGSSASPSRYHISFLNLTWKKLKPWSCHLPFTEWWKIRNCVLCDNLWYNDHPLSDARFMWQF